MTAPELLDPATLLRNTLAGLSMKQNDLAKRAGLSAKHVNQVAQGKVALTADVALRLERVTGVPAMEWMRAEAAYRDGLLRTRPRVWWSDRDGVLEELPGADKPLRVLRVVNGLVLDALPDDAMELVPSAPEKNTPDAAGFRSTDEALEWLRSIVVPVYGDVRSTGALLATTGEITHPSRHGGDRTLWDRYEAAKRLLDSANPRPAYWKKAP